MSKYRKNRNRYKYDDDFAENKYDIVEEDPGEDLEEDISTEEILKESYPEDASGEKGIPEEKSEEDVPDGESEENTRQEISEKIGGEEHSENGSVGDMDPEEETPSAGGNSEEEEMPDGEAFENGEPSDVEAEYPEEEYPEEEYPEDEYPEEEFEDEAVIRRRARRRRRIRNQALAYLCMLLLIVCIGACGYFAARKVLSIVHVKREQPKIDEQIEALAESEEEIVIEAPKIDDEEEEEAEEVDYLAEIVEACISEMPIEDKVAQLFIVTPESITGANKVTQAGDKTKEALEKYAVGGFIYFGGNIVDREQLTNMISTTDGYRKYRMFFAVDEEGGTCSRVSSSKIEVPDVGAMGAVGETGNPTKAFEAGQTIGTYLKELGFNVDFAPVADIVTVTENSAIGDRSFGSDPMAVGQMVANCVQGLQGSGISACLKHFPGLGDTTEDTHKGRAVITKTLDELQNANFESFRAGIEAGADFVMVAHATAENADDSGLPCSMSKNMITGQLRDYLGYDGIVITDALNMSAVTDYFPTEEICVKAFKAGVDILLMPDDFEKAYNALLEAVQSGSISEKRVDESLRRIFRVKFKNDIDNK